MAQWLERVTSDLKVPGSIPGERIQSFPSRVMGILGIAGLDALGLGGLAAELR